VRQLGKALHGRAVSPGEDKLALAGQTLKFLEHLFFTFIGWRPQIVVRKRHRYWPKRVKGKVPPTRRMTESAGVAITRPPL